MESAIHHEFLAIDEGLGTLLHVDETRPERNWIVPLRQPQARDMQLAGDGRVLIGHHHGYTEFEITTGRVMKEVTSFEGVTAARRLRNGHTRLAGVNLLGATGVVLLELDPADAVVQERVLPGDYVRLIRETAAGTFLMMCNTRIRETGLDGTTQRELVVDGFLHAWKAVRRPNGNTIASAGYGAFMVELGPAGAVLRKFGTKEDVPAPVNPFFYAMFQLLPDDHLVVANWQGHGRDHGTSGVQLLEFDQRGAIVWQWSRPEMISSLQGVLVLDGLDVHVPHDERGGIMAPLAPVDASVLCPFVPLCGQNRLGLRMKKTNFDRYLEEQLKDRTLPPASRRAGEAWDVALQIAALREQAGLSQAQLATLLKTSQQQISRLESPGYEGHSLSMLRRVAKALNARVRVVLEPADSAKALSVAEPPAPYPAEPKLMKAETGRAKRRIGIKVAKLRP